MFVVYNSRNEVIVTTLENEHDTLEELFSEDMGRNKEDYQREVHTNSQWILIEPTLEIS